MCLKIIFPLLALLLMACENLLYSQDLAQEEKILFLENMQSTTKDVFLRGANSLTTYKDEQGRTWFVKELTNRNHEQNSLICSYIASKLINFILPGSAPIVLPVLKQETGEIFIGSLKMDNFAFGDGTEKDFQLLYLILDLLDIRDRKLTNIGGVPDKDGDLQAVAIDLDLGLQFFPHVLWIEEEWLKYAKLDNIDEIKTNLEKIAKIPDSIIKKTIIDAINDLKSVAPYIIPFSQYDFETMVDQEYILDSILEIKSQMHYLAENIEKIRSILNREINNPLKCEKISDDKYAIFLSAVLFSSDPNCLQSFIKNGVNDPRGHALARVSSPAAIHLARLLLQKGSKDSLGFALKEALIAKNPTLAKEIILSGGKDPYGFGIAAAIEENDSDIVEMLLNKVHPKDPYGMALTAAITSGDLELAQTLLTYEVQDPCYYAIIAAINNDHFSFAELLLNKMQYQDFGQDLLRAAGKKGDIAFLKILMNAGMKDPLGYTLVGACEGENKENLLFLLEQGIQDPIGIALTVAAKIDNREFVRLLLNDAGTQDIKGTALFAIITNHNSEAIQDFLAQPSVQDPIGIALSAAIMSGNTTLAHMLLAKGARDSQGEALDAAMDERNFEIAYALLKYKKQYPEGFMSKLFSDAAIFSIFALLNLDFYHSFLFFHLAIESLELLK